MRDVLYVLVNDTLQHILARYRQEVEDRMNHHSYEPVKVLHHHFGSMTVKIVLERNISSVIVICRLLRILYSWQPKKCFNCGQVGHMAAA